jgi:hypothetical protein
VSAPLLLFRSLAVNERVFLRMMAGSLLDPGSISLRERECHRLHVRALWLSVRVGRPHGVLSSPGWFHGGGGGRRHLRGGPRVDRLPSARALAAQARRRSSRHRSGGGSALVHVAGGVDGVTAHRDRRTRGLLSSVSFLTNAFELPPEPYAPPFPGPPGESAGQSECWTSESARAPTHGIPISRYHPDLPVEKTVAFRCWSQRFAASCRSPQGLAMSQEGHSSRDLRARRCQSNVARRLEGSSTVSVLAVSTS